MATTGSATVSFGSTATQTASAVVTGQAGILTGSKVEAFMMTDSTAAHSAYEHRMIASVAGIVCGDIVAGTGFTIYVFVEAKLTGDITVQWVWT